MQILWLKRDLRLQAHAALNQAQSHVQTDGPVLVLYIHEPSHLAREDVSAQHCAFIGETLCDLRQDLGRHNGTLCECVGEAVDVLERLWHATGFTRLWAHQESTQGQSFERDKGVHAWCRLKGVTFIEVEQNGVRRGSAYRKQGFGFKEHLESSSIAQEVATAAPCQEVLCFARSPWPRPDLSELLRGRGKDKAARLRGGRSAALRVLTDFLQVDKLMDYPRSISSPNTAVDGCSRLSPYLAYGVLSDREVFSKLNELVEREVVNLPPAEAQALSAGVKFLAERLYWRSAYLQSFENKVESEFVNDLPAFDGERESELAPEWLEAWQEGRTGYPLVDAAMRMLAHTGWLNMRMRGMVTSFALNELWLPWRLVGLHLAREFLDYEPGIHWSQLQIHAGTSRLSGPLTYNTLKQAQDHDACGIFVKTWLPALKDVPTEHIIEPWKMPPSVQRTAGCQIGSDYPAPIVSLAAAHDAARQRVSALREGRPVPALLYWRQRAQALRAQRQDSLF